MVERAQLRRTYRWLLNFGSQHAFLLRLGEIDRRAASAGHVPRGICDRGRDPAILDRAIVLRAAFFGRDTRSRREGLVALGVIDFGRIGGGQSSRGHETAHCKNENTA